MASAFNVPPPEHVLTRWERTWFLIATNRTRIGAVILAVSGVARVAMHFQGHSEVADTLKAIADLFVAGGLATTAAGSTHGDQHFEVEKSKTIRQRSGTFRAVGPDGRSRR
jgi:hypothetical protein